MGQIFKDVLKGLWSIPFPPSKTPFEWCDCNKCGQWHRKAK